MEPVPAKPNASESAHSLLKRLLERRERLFKDSASEVAFAGCFPDEESPSMGSRLRAAALRPSWRWWPICRFAQSVFAEAFRQALAEGFAVGLALGLAVEVNPCPRFRRALRVMGSQLSAGDPLAGSLRTTGAWVDRGLLAALEVGEEYGCLGEELAAFARRDRGFSVDRYRRAIGRRPEATRFAAALARLLRDHGLTARVVHAAGLVSAVPRRRFAKVADAIAGEMTDGTPFLDLLGRHSTYFDPLFRGFLAAAESREEMRACLERLGRAEATTP